MLANESPELASKLANFGTKLVEAKAYKEAEPLLREALTHRRKDGTGSADNLCSPCPLWVLPCLPEEVRRREPLLLKGYEGMKSRSKTSHPGQLADLRKAIGPFDRPLHPPKQA